MWGILIPVAENLLLTKRGLHNIFWIFTLVLSQLMVSLYIGMVSSIKNGSRNFRLKINLRVTQMKSWTNFSIFNQLVFSYGELTLKVYALESL